MEFKTDYGMVSSDELIRVYHMWKRMTAKQVGHRNRYNQTAEGKEKNRENAKLYYERHKEEILAKKKARYQAKKEEYQMEE